jgi:hypothetical protein
MDGSYVFIICLPIARSFIGPFPPGIFAARRFAAVILPPLLFFAISNTSSNSVASLTQDLFDLADLFLHFTGPFLVFSFYFQPGVQADLSRKLLDLAHDIVEFSFNLVLRAGFHSVPP